MADTQTAEQIAICSDNKSEAEDLSPIPDVPPPAAALVEEEAKLTSDESAAPSWPQEAGPVVLRVKRRVTDEPMPTLAIHAKKLRLQPSGQMGGGAAVFRLAGTLHDEADEVALSQAVSQALKKDTVPRRQRRAPKRQTGAAEGRKRYRIVRRTEVSDSDTAGQQNTRAHKRKRLPLGSGPESSTCSSGTEGKSTKRSKCVHVFDVEFESASCTGVVKDASTDEESRSGGPSLDEYHRQLQSITLNDEQLLCTDAVELMPSGMEEDFVYDLYLSNAAPGDFVVTSDLDPNFPLEEDDVADEAGGWAFLLDGYEEDYNFPREYRGDHRAVDEADSDPESESNWRNEYPDMDIDGRECFSEEEFDLWMAGREPEASLRDSDDELRGYAYDDDLERGLREMELSKGVKIREYDPDEDEDDDEEVEDDLEMARERRHRAAAPTGAKSVRQMCAELRHERSKLL